MGSNLLLVDHTRIRVREDIAPFFINVPADGS